MPNTKQFSELEKACIDFYYHNDNHEDTKDNLLDMLSLAFTSDQLENYDSLQRASLMWTYKHLQKLLTAVYSIPKGETLHISELRDIAIKQNN